MNILMQKRSLIKSLNSNRGFFSPMLFIVKLCYEFFFSFYRPPYRVSGFLYAMNLSVVAHNRKRASYCKNGTNIMVVNMKILNA